MTAHTTLFDELLSGCVKFSYDALMIGNLITAIGIWLILYYTFTLVLTWYKVNKIKTILLVYIKQKNY